MHSSQASSALVEHFFRHESGRLTAVLCKRFGVRRLEAIEDAIQLAFERALGTWGRRGLPEEPTAWLTRVATNCLLDALRKEAVAGQYVQAAEAFNDAAQLGRLDDGVEDSLALLFSCADARLSPRVRLVLCLKLLSGFSTAEIANRLFLTPAHVQKTVERGRARLAELHGTPESNSLGASAERLATVQQVLYLQFNEGYTLGPEVDHLRSELCEEAIRLTRMLASHAVGDAPCTWALLALMHLNVARLPARLSPAGELVLLKDQDRSLWDQQHIQLGLAALRQATRGDDFSRYHGEAAIAVEHVLSPSFAETRFSEIVELYSALERMQPSPVYALNRAIALAECEGAELALQQLEGEAFPSWFRELHLYLGAYGEMLRRVGRVSEARESLRRAAESAPSRPERAFFLRRAAETGASTKG